MFNFLKEKASFLLAVIVAVTMVSASGCDDSGVENPPVVDNGVIHFDSINVADILSTKGMNLLNGTTVSRDSASKDVELVDSAGTFMNYYLRSGDMSDFVSTVVGFQTRFNRIYASMSHAQFDTITVIPDTDTTLNSLDFTANDTYGKGAWGYFNIPMSTSDNKPVFSFWLKGKSENFVGRNVFGILIPREASTEGGFFRMSFEVKINTFGNNDFTHTH